MDAFIEPTTAEPKTNTKAKRVVRKKAAVADETVPATKPRSRKNTKVSLDVTVAPPLPAPPVIEVTVSTPLLEDGNWPDDGPRLIRYRDPYLDLLMPFFIPGHKYVCLQIEEGTGKKDNVHPAFFQVTLEGGGWTEDERLPVRFVKHEMRTGEAEGKTAMFVTPRWEETWTETMLPLRCVGNCMPFDENRRYWFYQ
jgi:hypothetical protein